MKPKKLVLLVLIGLALGVWAWLSLEQEKRNAVPEAMGKPAFPGLDVNQVRKILVVTSSATVSVARVSGQWVVPERYGYPANFSKVAQCLRDLSEAKIWQIMNLAEANLDELNLLMPGQAPEKQPDSQGTLVTLLDEKDATLASILVGKPFLRKPENAPGGMGMMISGSQDGQYVRLADGRIVILPASLGRLLEDAQHWLADDFINVSSAQISELTVKGADGAEVVVRREPDSASLVLQGLADEEAPDSAKFNQLTGMLGYLGFHDVANPALTPEQTGLDKPVTLTAITTQGVAYVVGIGGQVASNNPDRYVSVKLNAVDLPAASVAVAPDSATNRPLAETLPQTRKPVDIANDFNKGHSNWVYIVKSYRIEPALIKREDLIAKKEPPAAPEAEEKGGHAENETNAAPEEPEAK